MIYTFFQKDKRGSIWMSVPHETPQHKSLRFDQEAHIKADVHAGFMGQARCAVSSDGFFFGLSDKGAVLSRAEAASIGLAPIEALLMHTTIYVHPGENRCRVYLLPYGMRPGQQPSDLKKDDARWLEVGMLNHELKTVYSEVLARPVWDSVEGQGGGTFFVVGPSRFYDLPEGVTINQPMPFHYDVFRGEESSAEEEFIARVAYMDQDGSGSSYGWKLMPANGSFAIGGTYMPGDKSYFPAIKVESLKAGLEAACRL